MQILTGFVLEWDPAPDAGTVPDRKNKVYFYNYNSNTHEDDVRYSWEPNVQGTWAWARGNGTDGYKKCFNFKNIELASSETCTTDIGIDRACDILLFCAVQRDGTMKKLTS